MSSEQQDLRYVYCTLQGLPQSQNVTIAKTFYECVYLSTCVYSPHREKTLSEEHPSSPTSLPEGMYTSGVARMVASGVARMVASGVARMVASGVARMVASGIARMVASGVARMVARRLKQKFTVLHVGSKVAVETH